MTKPSAKKNLEFVPVILNYLSGVMAGLVPAMMPATSAGITLER
jgi:hypothetical protein